MIIFLNTKINEKKRLFTELTEIYGVGFQRSIKIYQKLGYPLNYSIRFIDLSSYESRKIANFFLKNYIIGLQLEKRIKSNIKKYFTLNMYKGYRLQRNLPIRGQRTHTNAATIKRMNLKKLK